MNPPFIVTTPIRNEAWILEPFLSSTSLWADHILILDSGCDDSSLEICSRYPKVTLLPFHEIYRDSEYHRRKDLLLAARTIHPQSIVFTLDADEIISSEILSEPRRNQILQELEKPGQSLLLPWIMLWKSPLHYRTEPHGIWSDRWMRCVYWDDGITLPSFESFLHFPRVPRAFHNPEKKMSIPLLHYQFTAWKRTQIKQAHWRILEWDKGPQTWLNALRINLLYAITRETIDCQTTPIPLQWIQGYLHHHIPLNTKIDEDRPWLLQDILKRMNEKSPKYYAPIDLWDLPWEIYRQESLLTTPSLTSVSLNDPRTLIQQIIHESIQRVAYWGTRFAHQFYRQYLKF